MAEATEQGPPQSHIDKFKEAARELETDDDEARFDEKMRKLVKHKPAPGKIGGHGG